MACIWRKGHCCHYTFWKHLSFIQIGVYNFLEKFFFSFLDMDAQGVIV